MKTFIALLTAGVLAAFPAKWNRGQHYCYNATTTVSEAMFPRTQAVCYGNLPLCMRGADRARAANTNGTEISSCQNITRLYCITAHGTRWCSTDQYMCYETSQYFGIDTGCTLTNPR
jgi:hypothetical protein